MNTRYHPSATQLLPLMGGLSTEAKDIILSWVWEPYFIPKIARQLNQWRRIDEYRYAYGWVKGRFVDNGYTFEKMLETWAGSGSYLVDIGIGVGFMDDGVKCKRDEIGVHVHGRKPVVFRARDLYNAAVSENRVNNQPKLFNL